MDILSVLIITYLCLVGILFAVFGSNAQSRLLGLAALILAAGQGLKLAGLI